MSPHCRKLFLLALIAILGSIVAGNRSQTGHKKKGMVGKIWQRIYTEPHDVKQNMKTLYHHRVIQKDINAPPLTEEQEKLVLETERSQAKLITQKKFHPERFNRVAESYEFKLIPDKYDAQIEAMAKGPFMPPPPPPPPPHY